MAVRKPETGIFSRADMQLLVKQMTGMCGSISIFMPVYKTGADIKQNPARLKNLLTKAEQRLIQEIPRPVEARKFLLPIQRLIDDETFWQHPSDGLVIFLSNEMFRYYFVPLALNELVVVGDRFTVKPLLPLFSNDNKFYVLGLSQNNVRLLQCTFTGVREIDLAGIVPQSQVENFRNKKKERSFQYHASTSGRGKEAMVAHGQEPSDVVKTYALQYFQGVDKGLHEILNEETAPLVMAGVDYLLPIYRQANSYLYLFDKAVTGNPEKLSPEELRKKALQLVKTHFDEARQAAMQEYRQLIGTGHTSTDLKEIIPNAYEGKVEKLFVALRTEKWGIFNYGPNTVELHDKPQACDIDLLDFATAHTLLRRGSVYAVESQDIPGGSPIAAVYRHEKHLQEHNRIGSTSSSIR